MNVSTSDSNLSDESSTITASPSISLRIGGIDGLRGVSILIVLLSHSSKYLPDFIKNNFIFKAISTGEIGVLIFFTISGYLITKLLLNEQERDGEISIKNFYIRRSLRIFPVFFLYLLTLVVIKNTVFPDIFSEYSSILFSALYLWNYKHFLVDFSYQEVNGNWFMGHLWTLSMEEQFYLLWPMLFRRNSIKILTRIVIIIIILMPVIRVASYFFSPESRGQIGMMLHTGGDTILLGCLAALLEKSDKFMAVLRTLLNNIWLVVAAFLFVFVVNDRLFDKFGGAYALLVGGSLINISIMFLILWCLYIPSSVQRFLDYKWIKYIGTLSYSLYIWQQLILTRRYHTFFNSFPVNLLVVFGIALISYHLIEKPILRLKSKYN